MVEKRGNEPEKPTARERMITEAVVLLVFAWLVSIAVSLNRPPQPEAYAGFGPLRPIVATLVSGFEIFVFGYLLSRFFNQFKTGCAFVIILFFAYLVWMDRRPH